MQCQHKCHKLKALLLSTLIFACGGITGAALYATFSPRPEGRPSHRFERSTDFHHKIAEKISNKYMVSAENRPKVEEIIREGGNQLSKLGEEMRPKVAEIYESISQQLRLIIPEEKRAEFDADKKQRKDKLPPIFFRSKKGHDGPDGQPPRPGDNPPPKPKGD